MPEVFTLADLPPEVGGPIMKRIRVRLRPPLPPELSWLSDGDQLGDGPPTESVDVEFVGRGRGEVIHPVNRPPTARLVCEVPDEAEREGDQ